MSTTRDDYSVDRGRPTRAPSVMSQDFVPDLNAYFERIHYEGSQSPTLDTLHAITAHHVSAIPFENVDVLLGRGIDISPGAVQQKIVLERRGGYCFETNQLLLLVLKAMGFQAGTLSARVCWQLPRSVIPPFTHMFVQVEISGERWITDCGMGSMSLTAALRWQDGLVQETPHDRRRIVAEDGKWFHQVCFADEWLDVCQFTGDEMPAIDCQVANWWTSTHPDSRFRNNLVLSRAGLDGIRRTLLNTEFTRRWKRASPETVEIRSDPQLLRVLEEEFDLILPKNTHFENLQFPKNS
jgi:N-hydroxyarylamine O-acetyltransferase